LGDTPLHHACVSGDMDVIKALIAKKADPSILNE
jgi:ankyrin repeat protein